MEAKKVVVQEEVITKTLVDKSVITLTLSAEEATFLRTASYEVREKAKMGSKLYTNFDGLFKQLSTVVPAYLDNINQDFR